jgi:hypothetical protein
MSDNSTSVLGNSTIDGIADIGLGVLGGVNPILGGVLAAMKNAAAQKKKETQINDYAANANAKYNKLVNQDYLDSNTGRSMMTRITGQLKNANNLADKQAATTGATNESTLAAKTPNQGQYNDVVSNIAGMATAREDQMIGRQQNAQNNIFGLKTGIQDDKVKAAQTQAENSNSTMQSLLDVASTFIGSHGTTPDKIADEGSTGGNQLMGGLSADQALTNTSVQMAAPATMESQYGPDATSWDKNWALQFLNL